MRWPTPRRTPTPTRPRCAQILPTYTKVTAQAAAAHLVLNYFPATLSAAQLQRVADLMRSGGVLKSTFSVQPMLFH